MKSLVYFTMVRLDSRWADSIHVLEVAEGLARVGMRVTVVSFHPAASGTPCSVPVRSLWSPNAWVRLGWALDLLVMNVWCLVRGLGHARGCQAVYFRYSPHFLLFIAALRLWGKKAVIEVNGIDIDEVRLSRPRWYHRGASTARLTIERLSYHLAGRIVGVTPKIREWIVEELKVPSPKVFVVENGVNAESFVPRPKSATRETLRLPPGPCIGYIGSFFPWQGLDFVVQSLPEVLRRCPGAYAVLVGDGPLSGRLRQMCRDLGIEDSVIFPGSVSPLEAPMWVNCFDVGLVVKVPIRSGYSPLKLYGYMACGVPVVATRTEGFEGLEREGAGRLVEYGNREELVSTLCELLQDERLRRQMGTNGRAYVERGRTWSHVAQEIAEIIGKD